MQLKRKSFLILTAIAILGTAFGLGAFPLAAQWHDKNLRATPLGFSYRDRPFTGVLYEKSPGKLGFARLAFFYRGMREGIEIQWHANGQRSLERRYRMGQEDGIHRGWYEDGKVRFLKYFRSGMAHGDFYDWHSNGRLASYIRYDQGKEVVAKSWTGGGKPFVNYVWREQARVGLEGDTYCKPLKIAR